MRATHTLLAALLLCAASAGTALAQDDDDTTKPRRGNSISIGGGAATHRPGRFYWGSGMEGGLFQTSRLDRPGLTSTKFTTLRYSLFVNVGMSLNYDFSNNFGLFLPLSIRNIGFIDKIGDSTIKRRSYNAGAGLGVKVGNLRKRSFGFVGGGVDVPFNYREKGFVKRSDKDKFSEWFSDRTPTFMPFVFVGLSVNPGITLKVQYYPGNFLNPDYEQKIPNTNLTYKPYQNFEANLLYLTLGFNFNYKKTPKEDYSDMEAPAEKQL